MAISCADLMAEAEEQYPGVELETRSGKTLTLRNLMMLSDEGIKSAQTVFDSFQGTDAKEAGALDKMIPKMRDLLLLIASDTTAMKAEIKDWPPSMYLNALGAWQDATQVGEAEGSSS